MLLDRILVGSALTLGGLSLLAFVWLAVRLQMVRLLRRRRRSGRPSPMYCPTNHAVWWFDLLLPHRYFFRNTCGYDLSAQQVAADEGKVRCPECGRAHRTDGVHHARFHFRPGRASLAGAILATGCLAAVSTRTDDWIQWTPTVALIAIQETGVPWQQSTMRRELSARVSNGGESKWVELRLARLLVRDLHADELELNAHAAMSQLGKMGAAVRPLLVEAVRSRDWQQRQYAFIVLARLDEKCGSPAAEAGVIDAAIEALRDDSEWLYRNARVGLRFLYRHGQAEPMIRRRLDEALRRTDDSQQRLLCALLCGYLGSVESLDAAYPVLIECLEDNQIPGDAQAAAPALAGFGSAVIAPLEATLAECEDRQQELLIKAILFDLGASTAVASRPRLPAGLGPGAHGSFARTDVEGDMYYVGRDWLDEYVRSHRHR
ncbi:MAG: hypothetical protein IT430_07325 [Phycisphaerales bacterium]|nr:hypothetical protein [Phycisphaerales bacterium]